MLLLIFSLFTSWTTEVVTTETNVDYPPLAIDTAGNPYILVEKGSSLILYTKSNGNWIGDTFELNAQPRPDLTIDRYGRIWCIYDIFHFSPASDTLIVACKDASGWTKYIAETKDSSAAGLYYWRSIATDNFGIPHITYLGCTNGVGLGIYAYFQDTIWHKERVDSSIGDYCCSIDMDSQNRPHIAYFRVRQINEDLWYATKVDSVWHCEEVDPTNYASWWTTSIRVGPNGLPGIAYRDPYTYQMKYAWYDGTFWHIDTLAVQGGIGTQKALDIDSLNRPWIMYGDVDFPSNVVAYKDSNGIWHKYPLPLPIPPFTRSSPGALRIGRDGTIHVTRRVTNDDYTIREIQYIYGTPEGIEENDQILKPDSLTLEITITPNPTNGRFKVRFNSSSEHKVAVKIYDSMGRLVENVFDGKAKIGINEFLIMPENLSAGVYFILLEDQAETMAQKVVILK